MKLNKWFSAIIIVLLVVNLASMGFFWLKQLGEKSPFVTAGPPDEAHPPQPLYEFVSKELALNEAQKRIYYGLRDEHRKVTHELQDSLKFAKKVFFEKMADSTLVAQKLEDAYMPIANLQQKIDINTFYHFKKLREICNNEQKIKLDSLIYQILSKMKNMKGRPGPPL